MSQEFVEIISDQTKRTLWEVKNVIDCVPEKLWCKAYCNMPLWKHIYHMLHSLDLWFINPRDCNFEEPFFHEKDLNNLDVISSKNVTREEMNIYFAQIENKIESYIKQLQDEELLEMPKACEYSKFTLIMAQYRHLHSHMGMIMGFIIADTGLWPRVVGLEGKLPKGEYNKYF